MIGILFGISLIACGFTLCFVWVYQLASGHVPAALLALVLAIITITVGVLLLVDAAKMNKQEALYHCDCGRFALCVPTSAFEFEWRCVCGHSGVISWAHANPPPIFDARFKDVPKSQ